MGIDQFSAHSSPMREDVNEHEPANRLHVSETANDDPGAVDSKKKTRVVTQLPTVASATRTKARSLPRCIPVVLTPEPTCGHFPEFSIRELASSAII
jgi:hypothetical protein